MAVFHIGGSMTFADPNIADIAKTYLDGKLSQRAGLAEDKLPEVTVDKEVGSATIVFDLRLKTKAQRDTVLAWLNNRKAFIKANTSGYIQYHLCHHDTGGACEDNIIVSWGEAVV